MMRGMPNPPVRRLALLLVSLLLSAPGSGAATGRAEASADAVKFRGWVEEFKNSARGPFERIRWFCKDGTVQPPKAYACKNHGGGVQHGEWNARAVQMRAAGYAIANLLAQTDPNDFTGDSADLEQLTQILLERFLISWDDGWILRGARSYRGAFQIEDEEAGARRLLLAQLADPAWQTPARFALLRETARLMPLPGDDVSAAHVRQVALEIAQKDAGFTPLRAKIHNVPDAGDAQRVRDYAKSKGKAALADEYGGLAAAIARKRFKPPPTLVS